jgi:Mg2+-importing ATPase
MSQKSNRGSGVFSEGGAREFLGETDAPFWSLSPDVLLAHLDSTSMGLSTAQASQHLKTVGPNLIETRQQVPAWVILLRQFKSPLVLILIFAAIVSMFTQDWTDAMIILLIVFASCLLSFWQEFRATADMEKLRARLASKATVLRDGQPQSIPSENVVPGDVVMLAAGSLIPADGILLQTKDFYVSQAVLTGESYPVEKQPGVVPEKAGLAARTNSVFMGTSVQSGTAQALIVRTGLQTAYGRIAQRLSMRPPETEFESGIRRFGRLLAETTLIMTLVVFALNVLLGKPRIDSLLFAISLAVGITPELLPAIISVTLSKGAQQMAKQGVLVRRLNSIENFGSMDILCTDKTGTVTEGVAGLDSAIDPMGQPSSTVLRLAYLNASYQSGLPNPLDQAIVAKGQTIALKSGQDQKVDEIPFDFERKRLGIVIQNARGQRYLIVKGALESVLEVCTQAQQEGGSVLLLDGQLKDQIHQRLATWSGQGYRVLGVAMKAVAPQPNYSRADEQNLIFMGFLLFFDPPKPGVQKTISDLEKLGVGLKIITGDNRLVSAHVAEIIGLNCTGILTGEEIRRLPDEALWQRAEGTTLFVEVDPNQKERIITALRKTGHVVGYIGDGINDTTALHAADVGISVDTAADVAKEAADFVLLRQDLDVLRRGIEKGRTTFANTMKYVHTTTSSNFGNMFSLAGASLLLPFLPLLAKQVLLQNLLSDIPNLAIADDQVDQEMTDRPYRWDIRLLRKFMITFGLISSPFDFITFGVLLFLLKAAPEQFRTAWFVEGMLTQMIAILAMRTRRWLFKSTPARLLGFAIVVVAAMTIAIPYLPISRVMGFSPLPVSTLAAMLLISAMYLATLEVAKHLFFRKTSAPAPEVDA